MVRSSVRIVLIVDTGTQWDDAALIKDVKDEAESAALARVQQIVAPHSDVSISQQKPKVKLISVDV